MSDPTKLTEVLEEVEEQTDSNRLTLGDVLDTFEHRGFGPLLLIIALLIVMPTGGIPGVPTVLGITIILIASQLAWGREEPWLPKRLRCVSFKKSTYEKGVNKITPITRRIDRVIKPRLLYLVSGFSKRVIGMACVVLAMFMPFLEVVPFADIVPGTAIALMALGLTAKDGLLVVFGGIFGAVSVGAAAYWINTFFFAA